MRCVCRGSERYLESKAWQRINLVPSSGAKGKKATLLGATAKEEENFERNQFAPHKWRSRRKNLMKMGPRWRICSVMLLLPSTRRTRQQDCSYQKVTLIREDLSFSSAKFRCSNEERLTKQLDKGRAYQTKLWRRGCNPQTNRRGYGGSENVTANMTADSLYDDSKPSVCRKSRLATTDLE